MSTKCLDVGVEGAMVLGLMAAFPFLSSVVGAAVVDLAFKQASSSSDITSGELKQAITASALLVIVVVVEVETIFLVSSMYIAFTRFCSRLCKC